MRLRRHIIHHQRVLALILRVRQRLLPVVRRVVADVRRGKGTQQRQTVRAQVVAGITLFGYGWPVFGFMIWTGFE